MAETDKEGPMAESITVVGADAVLTVGEGRVTATDERDIGHRRRKGVAPGAGAPP